MQVWHEAGARPERREPRGRFLTEVKAFSFAFNITWSGKKKKKQRGERKQTNNGEAKTTPALLARRPNRQCDYTNTGLPSSVNREGVDGRLIPQWRCLGCGCQIWSGHGGVGGRQQWRWFAGAGRQSCHMGSH